MASSGGCEGCLAIQRNYDKLKATYCVLKQKIVYIDELMRLYLQKCAENDTLTNQVNQLREQLQRFEKSNRKQPRRSKRNSERSGLNDMDDLPSETEHNTLARSNLVGDVRSSDVELQLTEAKRTNADLRQHIQTLESLLGSSRSRASKTTSTQTDVLAQGTNDNAFTSEDSRTSLHIVRDQLNAALATLNQCITQPGAMYHSPPAAAMIDTFKDDLAMCNLTPLRATPPRRPLVPKVVAKQQTARRLLEKTKPKQAREAVTVYKVGHTNVCISTRKALTKISSISNPRKRRSEPPTFESPKMSRVSRILSDAVGEYVDIDNFLLLDVDRMQPLDEAHATSETVAPPETVAMSVPLSPQAPVPQSPEKAQSDLQEPVHIPLDAPAAENSFVPHLETNSAVSEAPSKPHEVTETGNESETEAELVIDTADVCAANLMDAETATEPRPPVISISLAQPTTGNTELASASPQKNVLTSNSAVISSPVREKTPKKDKKKRKKSPKRKQQKSDKWKQFEVTPEADNESRSVSASQTEGTTRSAVSVSVIDLGSKFVKLFDNRNQTPVTPPAQTGVSTRSANRSNSRTVAKPSSPSKRNPRTTKDLDSAADTQTQPALAVKWFTQLATVGDEVICAALRLALCRVSGRTPIASFLSSFFIKAKAGIKHHVARCLRQPLVGAPEKFVLDLLGQIPRSGAARDVTSSLVLRFRSSLENALFTQTATDDERYSIIRVFVIICRRDRDLKAARAFAYRVVHELFKKQQPSSVEQSQQDVAINESLRFGYAVLSLLVAWPQVLDKRADCDSNASSNQDLQKTLFSCLADAENCAIRFRLLTPLATSGIDQQNNTKYERLIRCSELLAMFAGVNLLSKSLSVAACCDSLKQDFEALCLQLKSATESQQLGEDLVAQEYMRMCQQLLDDFRDTDRLNAPNTA